MSLNVGRVLLSTVTTVGAELNVDFDDLLTSDYDRFEIDFFNVAPVTDSRYLYGRVGTGSTYDAGASDYDEASIRILGTTNTPSGFSDSTATGFYLTSGNLMGNGSGEKAQGTLTIMRPNVATEFTVMYWTTIFYSETPILINVRGSAARTTAGANPSFRFTLLDSGLSADANGFAADSIFKLYGIR
tara:strand:- start:6970 stop:7530 length:561 start_codon:yes stop_codon:yes gene_type:complete